MQQIDIGAYAGHCCWSRKRHQLQIPIFGYDRIKRGTVKLVPHQKEWDNNAENIVGLLKQLLGENH